MEAFPDVPPLLLLSEPVRQWVNDQGWARLRPIQVRALDPILAADRDVIISAATASGKTEAAFLPAFSHVRPGARGTSILYISPLKALIDDQYRRLKPLAARLHLPVVPWHGDLSWQDKSDYLDDPRGVLLTTPESLENFLLRHSGWCYRAFADLDYIIIDEFHSLVSCERGVQLISQLRRLEAMLRRPVPRVALSATFGSPEEMVNLLRPHRDDYPCDIVNEETDQAARFEVRTYIDVPPYLRKYIQERGLEQMVADLYHLLAGGHHLIFTNSRRRTEQIASALAKRCALEGRDNEFFPHHGSLSKEFRGRLESRLQNEAPASAVCTMTLELGIDIGNMDSIAQLDAPGSVASMRQRLGRAGRRGGGQLLRLFLLEDRLQKKSSLPDKLRLGLFQTLAVLSLLEQSWYEPASSVRPQYSTLVQQTLSVLAQYGAAKPSALWHLLCATGPFPVEQQEFMTLLKGLAQREMLVRDEESKKIKLTDKAFALTESRDFCTAFRQPPEYTLVSGDKSLGRLPMDEPLETDQRILFAGRAWSVLKVSVEEATIYLAPDSQGSPPKFGGGLQSVHDRVRSAMFDIYCGQRVPGSFTFQASRMLEEGRRTFRDLRLDKVSLLVGQPYLYLLPWKGDRFCRTVAALLRLVSLDASEAAGIVDIRDTTLHGFTRAVRELLARGKPTARSLTASLLEPLQEKFADLVDADLLAEDNMLRFYDLDAAWAWLENLVADRMAGKVNFF